VIDPGRAQRHDLEVGKLPADFVGEAVEADDGDLVTLEELDQLVGLHQAGVLRLELNVGIACR
jgi:hypothetical protein